MIDLNSTIEGLLAYRRATGAFPPELKLTESDYRGLANDPEFLRLRLSQPDQAPGKPTICGVPIKIIKER